MILELLKQRRVWAGISATLVFLLPLLGYTQNVNATGITNNVMQIVQGVAGLFAIFLPIWSYLKPKK